MSARGSMGKVVAGGTLFLGVSQGVRVMLTIASTIVVARILSPEDYGIVAMVAPVTAFVLLFQDLGLSQAAVQARTLSTEQSSALFWLNMGISAGLVVLLLALAPLLGWFYDEPAVSYITAASAATVLLRGSVLQHTALMSRHLRFKRLSAIDAGTAVVTFVATVAAALALRSYWALWLGTFVGTWCNVLLVWIASRWRPSLRPTFRGTGDIARFGGALNAFQILNFFSRNLDNILIGKVWGVGPLGLYDRSYKLMMFPLQNINQPLSRIMLPVMSRLQDEPERYRRSYLMVVQALMMVSVPGIAVAGATSERLIPFLLGEPWAEAAPIFFWLSLSALIQPLSNTAGWLFITMGRASALLSWGIFASTATVASFAIGVLWGPVGVAIAYFICSAAMLPILFFWSTRGTPVRAADLYAVALPSCATAGLTWWGVHTLSPQLSLLTLLAIALPAAYLVNVALYSLTRSGREPVAVVFRMIADAARRRLVK